MLIIAILLIARHLHLIKFDIIRKGLIQHVTFKDMANDDVQDNLFKKGNFYSSGRRGYT